MIVKSWYVTCDAPHVCDNELGPFPTYSVARTEAVLQGWLRHGGENTEWRCAEHRSPE